MDKNSPLIGVIAIVIIILAVGATFIYNLQRPSNLTTTIETTMPFNSTTIQSTTTISAQAYTLNLTNCNVTSLADEVALVCNYTSSIHFDAWHNANTSFTGPSGNLTSLYNNDGNGFYFQDNRVTLFMADYYQTPLPGTYTVVISYQNQLLVKKNFTFKGANVSVVDARPKTFSDSSIPNPSGGDEKYLGTINVTVYNSGDLPTYIGTVQVNITGPVSHDIGDSYIPYWIMPHSSYVGPTASPYAYPSGSYTISVDLLNYSGTSVAASSFPISVP